MVASPNTFMLASAGARTGMTAIMKAISRELAPFNVLVNQIQPERIDSNRQQQVARLQAEKQGISYEEAREQQAAGVAMGRLGRPAEIGAACAFLCAARFGYITGVNLRLDGGSYAGLL
jgi:3-oxoacyl-[acyl-carrier protein] reductase